MQQGRHSFLERKIHNVPSLSPILFLNIIESSLFQVSRETKLQWTAKRCVLQKGFLITKAGINSPWLLHKFSFYLPNICSFKTHAHATLRQSYTFKWLQPLKKYPCSYRFVPKVYIPSYVATSAFLTRMGLITLRYKLLEPHELLG